MLKLTLVCEKLLLRGELLISFATGSCKLKPGFATLGNNVSPPLPRALRPAVAGIVNT